MSKIGFLSIVGSFVFLGFIPESVSANDIVEVPERVIFLKGDSANVNGDMAVVLYDTRNLHFHDPSTPRFLFVDRDGNTALGIGGFVEGVAQYDFDGAIDGAGFTTFSIPVPRDPSLVSRLGADATHSSIFLQLVRRTRFGMLSGYVQTNFSGDNNGYGVKVKQAYVRLGGVTFGLTYSTFSDPSSGVPTIDYQGPSGEIGTKNIIVQYRKSFGGKFSAALSVENPEATYTDEKGLCSKINQRFPDIPIYFQYDTGDRGHIRISGIFRNLSYRNLVKEENKFVTGWGVQLSGLVTPFEGTTIFGQCAYGKGIGQYVNDLSGFGYDLISAGDGTMIAPKDLAIVAGVQYNFNKKFFVSASYSLNRVYDDGSLGASAYKRAGYIVANGFYTLGYGFQVGVEYLYGTRHNLDGQHGSANRVEAMIKYSF